MTEGEKIMTKEEVKKKIDALNEESKAVMQEYESVANGHPFYLASDDENLEAIKKKWTGLRYEMSRYEELLALGGYQIIDMPDEYTELPELIGSEKQIKWATDIRNKAFKKINKSIKEAIVEKEESVAAHYREWADKLTKCTYASWWIEHRYEMNHI